MARSRVLTSIGLALGASVATYLFATPHGRRTREAATDASGRWLRENAPDLSPQLARIERQIDALGTDLRRRLDTLQAELHPAMEVSFDVDRADVQRDLRDMPG